MGPGDGPSKKGDIMCWLIEDFIIINVMPVASCCRFLEAEEGETTVDITQQDIVDSVDILSAQKVS